MEKLTLNEEKVWTILKDFPNGAKAELLRQLTKLPRTTLYECLDGLTEKGYVENKNRKWYPKIAEAEKPSTEKLNTVKTALKHGILTKEDLEDIATIDFFLQNPELIGIDNSEESKPIKDALKLIKNFYLQKIESLKNIGADSE
jgi:sugar-specific transcriptional regulator TrmB